LLFYSDNINFDSFKFIDYLREIYFSKNLNKQFFDQKSEKVGTWSIFCLLFELIIIFLTAFKIRKNSLSQIFLLNLKVLYFFPESDYSKNQMQLFWGRRKYYVTLYYIGAMFNINNNSKLKNEFSKEILFR